MDEDGFVIGVLGTIPQDSSWGETCRQAMATLEKVRSEISFLEDIYHRCGVYPAFSVGLSHGGGQKVCFPWHIMLKFSNLLLIMPEARPL